VVRRLRQPLAAGLEDQARSAVAAAGAAVAGFYAAIELPPGWVADVQVAGGMWVRPAEATAADRDGVSGLPLQAPAEGLIVIGAAGHHVPDQVWQAVLAALQLLAPAERARLSVHAIGTTAPPAHLADLAQVTADVTPPRYLPPVGAPFRITAGSHDPSAGAAGGPAPARADHAVPPGPAPAAPPPQQAARVAPPLALPEVPAAGLGMQRVPQATRAFGPWADYFVADNPPPGEFDRQRARSQLAAVWLAESDRAAATGGQAPPEPDALLTTLAAGLRDQLAGMTGTAEPEGTAPPVAAAAGPVTPPAAASQAAGSPPPAAPVPEAQQRPDSPAPAPAGG